MQETEQQRKPLRKDSLYRHLFLSLCRSWEMEILRGLRIKLGAFCAWAPVQIQLGLFLLKATW